MRNTQQNIISTKENIMTDTAAVQDYSSFVDEYVDESGVDQNTASKGGTGAAPPPAGRAFARIVEYVEMGSHLGTFNGIPKKKPDALVRVVLELSGKRYPPIELDDGTTTPQKLFLSLTISSNEKSRFYKLFRAINGMYGDKYKHFASMAADNVAFIVTISHRDNGKTGDDKREYANIWKDGAWHVEAAVKRDDELGTEEAINVVPATSPTKIFLFNRPRLVDWANIFIDGLRDDGTSKNWIQEEIMTAVNFEGSALEAMLIDLPVDVAPPAKAGAKAAAKKATAKADPLGDI
jgi:hypothetical protein